MTEDQVYRYPDRNWKLAKRKGTALNRPANVSMKSGDNVDENISAASVINAEGNGHSSEMGIMYEDSMNFSMYESNSNSISLHDTSKTSVGHPLNVSYLSCFKA